MVFIPKGGNVSASEINFDGLVGPTHNYAGLSHGNVASTSHRGEVSHPRQAALQGLEKMKSMLDLGLHQGVLPPHERPHIATLRALGMAGSDQEVLEKTLKSQPQLLALCSSASSMWTANAATVSPSVDCRDGRVHLTAANLSNKFHRSIEAEQTARTLQAIFHSPQFFCHHQPLVGGEYFSDEGAANHTRFCHQFDRAGVELFVYGKEVFNGQSAQPVLFPARQTKEASAAIARLHGLNPQRTLIIQQNPAVIDQGVFHNDVISVGHRNIFFCHDQAFLQQERVIDELSALMNGDFHYIKVLSNEVSVNSAVKSYLFNSQIVDLGDKKTALIAPLECLENEEVKNYLDRFVDGKSPIHKVIFQDVKQSMKNGGGPACLRLRVVLTDQEREALRGNCLLTPELYVILCDWVKKHYRDRLSFSDLGDYLFLNEVRVALDELTTILGLGPIYPFQR